MPCTQSNTRQINDIKIKMDFVFMAVLLFYKQVLFITFEKMLTSVRQKKILEYCVSLCTDVIGSQLFNHIIQITVSRHIYSPFVLFLMEVKLLIRSEHLSSLPVFCGVRVTRSLGLCVCFLDRCFSYCPFTFDHCVVCSSLIYGF